MVNWICRVYFSEIFQLQILVLKGRNLRSKCGLEKLRKSVHKIHSCGLNDLSSMLKDRLFDFFAKISIKQLISISVNRANYLHIKGLSVKRQACILNQNCYLTGAARLK